VASPRSQKFNEDGLSGDSIIPSLGSELHGGDEGGSKEKKAELNKLLEMDVADLEAAITDGEKKIEDAEETFKTELQTLQDHYQELMKTKEDTIAEVKSSGLGRMKSVLAHRSKGAEDKDEL